MGTAVDTGGVDKPRRRPTQRGVQAVELRGQGLTYEQIGQRLGVSRQRANQLYWGAMHAVQVQTVEAHRAVMLEDLAEIVRVANKVMHTDHLAHSNGRVVRDDDGTPVIDDGPKLNAAHVIIAAQARLSRLIGADAPAKVDMSGAVSVSYQVELGDGDAAREALT